MVSSSRRLPAVKQNRYNRQGSTRGGEAIGRARCRSGLVACVSGTPLAYLELLSDEGTGSVSAVYGRQPIGGGSLFAQWRQLKQECSFIQSATKQLRSMHENRSLGGQLQCQHPENPESSNSTTIV